MRKIQDYNLKNKVVLVRSDLNVPLENGVVKDVTRLSRSISTLKYIIDQGGICCVMSHLGRPSDYDPKYSLECVKVYIEEYLGKKVKFLDNFDSATKFDSNFVYLYQNTRFFLGETENSPELAKRMSDCCDLYVMDAFASAHRKHASTYGVMDFAKDSCAGLLLSEELDTVSEFMHDPGRPCTAVIGGAKISGKIELIDSLLDMVDILAVVGGMANTFLKSQGHNIGKSLCEDEKLDTAREIINKANDKGVLLYLPQDFIVANDKFNTTDEIRDLSGVKDDDIIFDVGKKTVKALATIALKSDTILWNGPLGMFEKEIYANGSISFAKSVATASAKSLVGGGDTIRVLTSAKMLQDISYVSTGGGAFLELISKKTLPVLDFLEKK